MPAVTWNRALVLRYEEFFPNGPVLWGGGAPEGTSGQGYPNVKMIDLGQKPVYQQGDNGKLSIAYFDAMVKFNVYGDGDAQADAQAQLVMDAMESGPLLVGLDEDVRLFLQDYRVNQTNQRGKLAEWVFIASVLYKASFNRTGGGPR